MLLAYVPNGLRSSSFFRAHTTWLSFLVSPSTSQNKGYLGIIFLGPSPHFYLYILSAFIRTPTRMAL